MKTNRGDIRACVPCWLLVLSVGFWGLLLSPIGALASLTCHEEVVKIELLYSVGEQSVTAQVHMKNGVALKWSPRTEKDERMLFEMVKIMSGADWGTRRSRMFLTVEDDVVRAFKVVTANSPGLCC